MLQGDDAAGTLRAQGLKEQLQAFSEANRVPVHYRGAIGSNGWCRYAHSGKPVEIVVDPLLPPLHQGKTLCHEIAHSLLHCGKDYRQHQPRSLLELEAESVAYIVLNYFGLDTSAYSFAYIATWQKDEDAITNLITAGSRIQKAAHQIISGVEAQFPQNIAVASRN